MSQFLQALIETHQAGQADISSLHRALEQRGRVDDHLFREELAILKAAYQQQLLPPDDCRALARTLKRVQTASVPPPPSEAESITGVTRVDAPDDAGEVLDLSTNFDQQNIDKTLLSDTTDATLAAGPPPGQSASRTGPTQREASHPSGPGDRTWSQLSSLPSVGAEIGPGYVIKDRFVLIKELGRGGMGLVYQAKDLRKEEAQDRNPFVAIKLLNDDFRRHPDALKALQREARKSQQLNHDNIVRVYDFDRDGGTIYMTMEFVEGKPLNETIREPEFNGWPMSRAGPIIEGMGQALMRAHREGIIHSDFKPGNVMLRSDGVPKVFDFGIARAAATQDSAAGETTQFDAASLGALTPAYASLAMLKGAAKLEPQDDLYALAISSYELLTGQHPYQKKSALRAKEEGIVPPRPVGLHRGQWRMLQSGLAFEKADQPRSVEEFLDGLLERKSSLQRYQWPIFAATAIVLILLLGQGPLCSHLHKRAADSFLEQMASGGYPSIDAAQAAWQALPGAAQPLADARGSDVIRDYFVARGRAAWNPEQGAYDFPRAARAYEQMTTLSARTVTTAVEELQRINRQKNEVLNALNDDFIQRLELGALFQSDAEGIEHTLGRIREIQPDHPLLTDARLRLAYADAIRQSIDGGAYGRAGEQLDIAAAWFPQEEEFSNLRSEVADIQQAVLAEAEAEALARQRAEQKAARIASAKAQVDQLLARPTVDRQWDAAISRALADAAEELEAGDAWLATSRERAAARYVQWAQGLRQAGDLDEALVVAGLGLELSPEATALQRERETVLAEQRRIERAAASRAERIETVKARLDALLGSDKLTQTLEQDISRSLADAEELLGRGDRYVQARRDKAAGLYIRFGRDSLNAGELDEANRRLAVAQRFAPGAADAQQLSTAIADARELAEARQREQQRQIAERNRAIVLARLNNPEFTPTWEQELGKALAALAGRDEQYSALSSEVARAYSKRVEDLRSQNRFDQALAVIDRGLGLVPDSRNLKAERSATLDARQRYQEAQVAAARAARIDGFKRSLQTQAAANDVDRLGETYKGLEAELGADDPYVSGEAARLVGEAFARRAEQLLKDGNSQTAYRLAQRGLALVPGRPELESLVARIAPPVAASATPAPADSQSVPARPTESSPQVATAPRATPRPVRPAVDPCEAGFAGYGTRNRATCFDTFGNDRGPRLVVVPGISGGAPFAIGKFEVSVSDYNRYCQATPGCRPLQAASGLLPATGLDINAVRAYIDWLSRQSGFDYRLPTDDEWRHAVAAGGQPGDQFNCVLRQGATVLKGEQPVQINVGQANGWGLLNAVGNVQEVVEVFGRFKLRGGGYRDPMSLCSPELLRDFSGSADDTVGFRVVRPLG